MLNCAKNACAVRVAQILLIVRRIAEKMGIAIDEFVCMRSWLWSFFQRHEELAKRLPSKTNQARLTHWNRISVARWTAETGPLASQYTPQQTWNGDDSGWDLESLQCKVSGRMGGKSVFFYHPSITLSLQFPSIRLSVPRVAQPRRRKPGSRLDTSLRL